MRARNLKPSLFMNEVLGTADPHYTLLFEGLWCCADREGRIEDRPARLRAEIFPYRQSFDIEQGLGWLKTQGFIDRYNAKGLQVIQVLTFTFHQHPHPNERPSALPTKEESTSNQGKKRVQPKNGALRLTPDSGLLTPDSPLTALPPSASVPGLDCEAWQRFEDYRKNRKPAIRPESREAAMKALAAFGDAQAATVEHTIANGYQGLVGPKAGYVPREAKTKFSQVTEGLGSA